MSDYGTGYNGEECPFCWGTGVIVMVYDNCTTTQPCPEGCLASDEVPF